MPRIARVVVVAVPHHITQRGNNGQPVFFSPQDREVYLQLLQHHCLAAGLTVQGFCLMGNHVHLIATPSRPESLAQGLGRTHNDYSRWLHIRRRDSGHLWQNRFYSTPLDEAHFWQALRYVELNPVRAGLVTVARDWPWSSAVAHVSQKHPFPWLDLSRWRTYYTPARWRAALTQGLRDEALTERIRQATLTGRPLGSDLFVDQLENDLGRPLRPQKAGPRTLRAQSAQ